MVPPLQMTRLARSAASAPGRKPARNTFPATAVSLQRSAVAAITVTGNWLRTLKTMSRKPGWPVLPKDTYTIGRSVGRLFHQAGLSTVGDHETGPMKLWDAVNGWLSGNNAGSLGYTV